MAFIRKKIVKGVSYYALGENYRENGKVKQRLLVSLGTAPTLAEAYEETRRRVGWYTKLRDDGHRQGRHDYYVFEGKGCLYSYRWAEEPSLSLSIVKSAYGYSKSTVGT